MPGEKALKKGLGTCGGGRLMAYAPMRRPDERALEGRVDGDPKQHGSC